MVATRKIDPAYTPSPASPPAAASSELAPEPLSFPDGSLRPAALSPLFEPGAASEPPVNRAGDLGRAMAMYQKAGALPAASGAAPSAATYVEPKPAVFPGVGKLAQPPGLLRALFEKLFGWLPFVSTDQKRLSEQGRRFADERAGELEAYRYTFLTFNTARDPEGALRASMKEALATRIEEQARLAKRPVSREQAEARAEIFLQAMYARRVERMQQDAQSADQLPNPEAKDTKEAAFFAAYTLPTQRLAERLGGPWKGRLDAALRAPISSEHRELPGGTKLGDDDYLAVRRSYVQTVGYLMGLADAGALKNVPEAAVDRLLEAQRAGLISLQTVTGAVSALSRLSAVDQERVLAAVQSVPEDRRAAVAGVMAREWIGLSSSDGAERQASMLRIEKAAGQAAAMSPAQAVAAFEQGKLGLEAGKLTVEYSVGGKKINQDIPIYFHPSVPAADRAKYTATVGEAFKLMPYPMVKAMLAGEGRTAGSCSVQLYSPYNLSSGMWTQTEPRKSSVAGWYTVHEDQVRLDAQLLDRVSAYGPMGAAMAVNVVLHEAGGHFFDDLADPAERQGYLIGTDTATSGARTQSGDLQAAWDHYQRLHTLYDQKLVSDDGFKMITLSRKASRTPAEEQQLMALEEKIAGRGGAVSSYAATGGGVSAPARQLGEWWADTLAAYLNPATRERLRAVDPVAYEVARQVVERVNAGATPAEALKRSLQYNLSTETSGREATDLLAKARPEQPLAAKDLSTLDGVVAAYESHARALDRWQAYDGDPDLKKLRKEEAQDGLREGQKLRKQIDQRRAALAKQGAAGGPEDKALQALSLRLDQALADLEQRAKAI